MLSWLSELSFCFYFADNGDNLKQLFVIVVYVVLVVVFSFQFIQKAVKVGKERPVLDYSVLLIFPQRLLFCLFMGYASCIGKNVMVVDGQEFD